jgi:nicotinate-nucleotide--dimethylbenzimidazole phosphoribosyltransferase
VARPERPRGATAATGPATWARPVPVVGDVTSAAERAANPRSWRFGDQERQAFYAVVAGRRDIRRFRPDPIDPGTVERVLSAAHAGPSVGHSQPWRFLLVTEAGTRERAAVIAERERQRQANLLAEDARRRMLDLQLDGIREAPLGVVVCCDRRAAPTGVLGRATFPDADMWSCACAIENLWLAARAEGLGMGWVTLFPPDELSALVGLPGGVETLGWLCLGWPDELPPSPGLERVGWSRRAPLDEVVLHERWDARSKPPTVSELRAPDQSAVVGARDQADTLLTPPGSLGVLDRAIDRLVALGIDTIENGCLVLAAADHPVTRHAVSTYPSTVTREVLEATLAGESLGAAAARSAGLHVVAVDAGVDGGLVSGAVDLRPVGHRGDLVEEDAMPLDDVGRLLQQGYELGRATAKDVVALGEAGVGNTTVAAVLSSLLLGLDAEQAVGLGAGGDSATLARKRRVVDAALARARARLGAAPGPLAAMAAVGGPEFVVLAGVVLGTAQTGRSVILDGLATSVAALCAARLEPGAAAHLVAGQRSREVAHAAVLEHLGLEPLLDLRMRAGEGVGAVLSSQLLAHGLRMRAVAGRVAPPAVRGRP